MRNEILGRIDHQVKRKKDEWKRQCSYHRIMLMGIRVTPKRNNKDLRPNHIVYAIRRNR